MKALNLQRLCVLGVMGVLPLAFTFSAAAGEKIIVTEGKSQADPTKDVRTGSDLFKSSKKFEEPNLYDGYPVLPRFGPALSKKEQDRLKMKREAQKDWLVNPQDDAQRREEEEGTLGVKDNILNDLNKGGKTSWLEPKSNPNQRLPGQLQSLSQKQAQAEARQAAQEQRNREEAEDESKGRTKTFDLNSSEGAHTASELNLKTLFDPSQKENLASAGGAKADFSLGTLLGSTPARSKDYQARMDNFNKLFTPVAQPGQNLFTPGNPLSPQLGAPAAPALATKPPEAPVTRPTGGDFFRQNPGSFGSGPSRFDPPGMPSLNNNNSAFGSPSPFQRQMPAAQDSSRNWSMKPAEPQRRKF